MFEKCFEHEGLPVEVGASTNPRCKLSLHVGITLDELANLAATSQQAAPRTLPY